jgi:hypothetical protein
MSESNNDPEWKKSYESLKARMSENNNRIETKKEELHKKNTEVIPQLIREANQCFDNGEYERAIEKISEIETIKIELQNYGIIPKF